MPKRKDRPENEIDDLSPAVTFVEDEQDVRLHDEENEPESGDAVNIPDELPILPLRGLIVYPQTAIPLTIGQPRSVRLVDEAVAGDLSFGLWLAAILKLKPPPPNETY